MNNLALTKKWVLQKHEENATREQRQNFSACIEISVKEMSSGGGKLIN